MKLRTRSIFDDADHALGRSSFVYFRIISGRGREPLNGSAGLDVSRIGEATQHMVPPAVGDGHSNKGMRDWLLGACWLCRSAT